MPLVATALTLIYALLPVGVWGFALRRWQRYGQRAPVVSLLFTCILGTLIGVGMVLLNGWLLEGRVPTSDAARTIHICVAGACAVKLVDWLTMHYICRWLGMSGEQRRPRGLAMLGAFIMQRAVVVTLTLAYALALLMAYRPRVVDGITPAARKLAWQQERLASGDGIDLNGWFLPAGGRGGNGESSTTVLICHGIGSRKQLQLGLAEFLVGRGYNVMIFDFRAHGASGGNSCSYGAREWQDVLAAARQLKQKRPKQSQRVVGLGINTGAAALMLAGAEDHDGQFIDALVLVEPLSSFDGIARESARRLLPTGLRQVATWISTPVASFHAGAWLGTLRPADSADALWPRPVLVIHGRGQTFVTTEEEMDLFQRLPGPRQEFWPADNYQKSQAAIKATHGDAELIKLLFRQWMGLRDATTGDGGVRERIVEFLRDARSEPVI